MLKWLTPKIPVRKITSQPHFQTFVQYARGLPKFQLIYLFLKTAGQWNDYLPHPLERTGPWFQFLMKLNEKLMKQAQTMTNQIWNLWFRFTSQMTSSVCRRCRSLLTIQSIQSRFQPTNSFDEILLHYTVWWTGLAGDKYHKLFPQNNLQFTHSILKHGTNYLLTNHGWLAIDHDTLFSSNFSHWLDFPPYRPLINPFVGYHLADFKPQVMAN